MSDYDQIGVGYPRTRQGDPRIAAAVEDALGDARTLVNVGAGTGSYEPADREVTAVEPWWARPEAYLDPVVRDGCSGLRAMDPEALTAGMERLEADLRSGAWDERHAHLRGESGRDMGYRLVVGKLDEDARTRAER